MPPAAATAAAAAAAATILDGVLLMIENLTDLVNSVGDFVVDLNVSCNYICQLHEFVYWCEARSLDTGAVTHSAAFSTVCFVGCNFFWSSRPKAERRNAGVAFSFLNDIVYQRQDINNRLMNLCLPSGDKIRHHHRRLNSAG
nr:unnamed protein product [Spirometra erinaceieuropaei]